MFNKSLAKYSFRGGLQSQVKVNAASVIGYSSFFIYNGYDNFYNPHLLEIIINQAHLAIGKEGYNLGNCEHLVYLQKQPHYQCANDEN